MFTPLSDSSPDDRVRAAVAHVCGCEDDVVEGMVKRHLERMSGLGSPAEHAELEGLLNVLIGTDASRELASMVAGGNVVKVARVHGASSGLSPASHPSQPGLACHPRKDGWTQDGTSHLVAPGMKMEADVWPFGDSVGPLPANAIEALDANGPFGAAARGVEVRPCVDEPAKGKGVFARRRLVRGELVGLYWGEKLTRREYLARHGETRGVDGDILNRAVTGRSAARGSLAAILDRATAVERRTRLDALSQGHPMSGGTYVFRLPAEAHCLLDGEPVYCVDAEDPNRSAWCRYLNHAKVGSAACNVDQKVNAEGDIWFVTNRDIAVGSELCFDYGSEFPEGAFGGQSS